MLESRLEALGCRAWNFELGLGLGVLRFRVCSFGCRISVVEGEFAYGVRLPAWRSGLGVQGPKRD